MLERWDPARYARRRPIETSGMVPIREVRALLVARAAPLGTA
jgi:hypothetical protein